MSRSSLRKKKKTIKFLHFLHPSPIKTRCTCNQKEADGHSMQILANNRIYGAVATWTRQNVLLQDRVQAVIFSCISIACHLPLAKYVQVKHQRHFFKERTNTRGSSLSRLVFILQDIIKLRVLISTQNILIQSCTQIK